MQHVSTTPFGRRPVSAGILASQALAQAPCPVAQADKWSLFHDLRAARAAFGVSDRDLTVLNALLSFLPARELADGAALIVHPSNAALSDRAHGMAESTLRRHLAALVQAGLIARHDSPNGKRYVSRAHDGAALRAFGFDLRPLLVLAERITAAADAARRADRDRALARELAVLRLRDAGKLLAYAVETGLADDVAGIETELAAHRRTLRRRLSAEALVRMAHELGALCVRLSDEFAANCDDEIKISGGNDVHFGRHQHNSNPDSPDLEPCHENGRTEAVVSDETIGITPKLPLGLVLKACPDILPYAGNDIRDWRALVAAAAALRGMMGISRNAWDDAQLVMGSESAAICVAAMLQRVDHIRNPGAYLRSLTERARAGMFSTGPMVMALLSPTNRVAA